MCTPFIGEHMKAAMMMLFVPFFVSETPKWNNPTSFFLPNQLG